MTTVIDPKKLSRLWSRLLIKELKDYAKQNTKTWFGAKFSTKSTPFQCVYSKKKNAVFVFGNPPNKNVDKHHKQNKRVPWGKTAQTSTSTKYNWHGEHYHRVFIADDNNPSRGFWFTAKTKWENTGTTFYTKHSHYDIEADAKGYRRVKGAKGRNYPFPVQWKYDSEGLHFDYHFDSVSDKVMNSPELATIIDRTLTKALESAS